MAVGFYRHRVAKSPDGGGFGWVNGSKTYYAPACTVSQHSRHYLDE
jgi:hypothetical protein